MSRKIEEGRVDWLKMKPPEKVKLLRDQVSQLREALVKEREDLMKTAENLAKMAETRHRSITPSPEE